MLLLLRGGGVLLALVGIVWIFQGTGYLRGSFMTSQPFWAWAGVVALALGVGLLYIGFRRKTTPPVQ